MMKTVISWSVINRWTVLILTLALAVWGAWSFVTLPIDAVPDITNQQVQVNATSQGLSPDDLETKVTYPIEIAMGGIPGVTQIRSITKFGLSQVTIVFDDATDIYRDRQLVSERLQTVSNLPPGVDTLTLGPVTTGLGEIYHYTIGIQDGDDAKSALMKARDYQERIIKPRLLTVPGVAEVNVIGGYARQLQIQPDLRKMATYRLNLTDIKEALLKTNRNAGGGYVVDGPNQLLVQARGEFSNLEDVKRVPIKVLPNLKSVRIGDVAKVVFDGATRSGAALVNGREAVLGTVMMLSGSNSRSVSRAVARRIQELIKSGELPKEVTITPLYDRSALVDQTLNTVIHNLVIGAGLVMLILFLLLGNLKAALTVSISIPVTLLATFGFMRLLGISGNLMSLGALDFGIIVDGSVIVVDQCVRWIQDRANKASVREKVIGASVEIRSAAGFGQLMIIVVFLPILALVGIEGKMFRPMAQTFSIALAVALLLSFTFIPAMAGLLFSDNESDKTPWLMRNIQRAYEPLLRFALRHTAGVLGVSLLLIVIATFLFTRLGAEFLPRLDEGSLVLQISRKVETSLESSIAAQSRSEKAIRSFGAVEGVFSRIGTAEVATDPMGPNESDTFVLLKDKGQWQNDGRKFSDKEKMVQALIDHVNVAEPEQEISATQPIQMRFNDMLEGTRADLTIKVYGEKLEELTAATTRIANALRPIQGSGDVQTEFKGGIPILRIDPKLDVLSRYSLSASPVLEAIGIGMGGEQAGLYFEGLRRVPVVVKLAEKTRNSAADLKEIQVYAGDQLTVPLREVADFKKETVLSPIIRENSKRRSAVLVNPRGTDLQSFVKEAQAEIASKVNLPTGTIVEWSGSFKNLEDAKERLLIIGPLALLLVAGMIFWAFRSWLETFTILATIPLALVGGVFGLYFADIPFSISAAVGFVALSGIAVLNGVVLVHYYNELRSANADDNLKAKEDWIVLGASVRLRAVLMTALVDIFGFIPMSISTGVGAEVQRPLAMVVIGGVLTSTVLTLVVLPVIINKLFSSVREAC